MSDELPVIPTQDGLPPCAPRIAALKPLELELQPGQYSWCTCGHSANQPFCDGTHKLPETGTNRRSLKFDIGATQTVRLCRCKHTATPPFCDGTHATLCAAEQPAP